MKTGGRRAPDVREGGGDGDGYRRVAAVASGEQRRRVAATNGDVDDDWRSGGGKRRRQRAATGGAGDACSGGIPSLAIVAAVGCWSSSYDDEALRKPTEVCTVGIHR
jgi:hypothetical protein